MHSKREMHGKRKDWVRLYKKLRANEGFWVSSETEENYG